MDIDILSHDVWRDGVPHDQLSWLRREAPVFKHPMPDGVNDHTSSERPQQDFMWVLTRHEDVRMANRDAERFSSEAFGVQLWDDPGSQAARTLISVDPPDHTRLRRLINRGFTPRMISHFEEHFTAVSHSIIDEVVGRETFDFVTDVAAELPLIAISELLGIPIEDRRNIFDWTNAMIGSTDPEYNKGEDEATLSAMAVYQYATKMADIRRENPRDDIITKLITEVDGDALGPHEFELFVLILCVAGSETTPNAITHGLMALLEHPDQMALLRSDVDRYLPTAVDEMIRWATPVAMFRRTALVDVEIRGQKIAGGEGVLLHYTSANRDEAVFEDPFTFDITRSPNDHVSFGGGGPHFCLGANLAKLEVATMFRQLLDRTTHIEATGPAERLRSNFINGVKHLPVSVQVSA